MQLQFTCIYLNLFSKLEHLHFLGPYSAVAANEELRSVFPVRGPAEGRRLWSGQLTIVHLNPAPAGDSVRWPLDAKPAFDKLESYQSCLDGLIGIEAWDFVVIPFRFWTAAIVSGVVWVSTRWPPRGTQLTQNILTMLLPCFALLVGIPVTKR